MSESAHAPKPKVVRFGVFDIDMQAGQLCKAGLRVKLQEQPFQVLAALLEHPGEVVTREELRQRLWPADTFVDFDVSLNGALKKLRFALGDAADSPTFIETIPRRGYRFIATVKPVTVDFVNRSGPAWAGGLSWPQAAKMSLIALAAAAAILVVWRLDWRARSLAKTNSQTNIQSLAVLPLENLSGDPSQDYFADGMTDELITNLGQIGSLRVISRTSVMQYRGVHKPLPQIARELNVDTIVEGTVVRSGGQVRITAQLIQASADKHLWAQSYERDLKDVLGLQREIANAIAKHVGSTLAPPQIRLGSGRPTSPEVYESYLKGEYFLNRFTPDSIRKAADYFQQAIEKDPNYAPAYSKLAGCYQILAGMGAIPKKVAYPKAKVLVAKALELDPQFAAAHAVRGWSLLLYELDFATAGAELKRAVELNPNGVEGHQGLGDYYATMGQLQESVLEVERARELDPLASIVNSDLCTMLFFARRYDEALAQCKANLDLDPNSVRALWFIGDVYAAKGMNSEAVSTFLQAMQLGGAPPGMIAAAKTGDADMALRSLEKAVEARCYGITYLAVNPMFDELRSDPRFVSLLRRIGLPQSQARN